MATDRPARLPIGVSDFRKVREGGMVYVDKTDFVTQVLTGNAEVMLVPRPRRFGKTLNLSTVRAFVEKTAEDRSGLFEGLSVWGAEEARAHFQRYPVISLTFKDIEAGRFEDAADAIRLEIRHAYNENAYLLDEGTLRPEDASHFRQILTGEGPEAIHAESLRVLSAQLARHHRQRVVILVDEYDTPIHSAASPGDERRLLDFFRAFLSGGLEDNPHLFEGVLTGILRIAKESLFSAQARNDEGRPDRGAAADAGAGPRGGAAGLRGGADSRAGGRVRRERGPGASGEASGAEAGSAEAGSAEAGSAEAGSAEAGGAEAGSTEAPPEELTAPLSGEVREYRL